MNKVVSMNLNGNAYQLDEPGFAALSAYLTQAKARLSENPDQAEILADLEQAVADKLRRFLSSHKSVVTAEEVETVIAEMGPVDGGSEAAGDGPEAEANGPKRLYRIEEGEWIAGVATGLAAYFNIEVHLVRILMVLLALLTSGGFVFGYLLAWIFIPPARTQEERAEARGAAFNTEELIARAKAEYEKIDRRHAAWKSERKNWKREKRESYKAYAASYPYDWRWHGRRRSSISQLMSLTVLAFLLWLGYHHVPDVRQFLDSTWTLLHRAADDIAQIIVAHQ